MLLRDQLSRDWVKYLPIVTEGLNESPLQKLGYLCPNDITDPYDSALVDKALREHNLEPKRIPTFQEQNQNQIRGEKKAKLKRQDYVFLDFEKDSFSKGFDLVVTIAASCWLIFLSFRSSFLEKGSL